MPQVNKVPINACQIGCNDKKVSTMIYLALQTKASRRHL